MNEKKDTKPLSSITLTELEHLRFNDQQPFIVLDDLPATQEELLLRCVEW